MRSFPELLKIERGIALDFDQIKTGVENGAPRMFAWRAVFGIVLTVIWLYIEILRMLAILRGE